MQDTAQIVAEDGDDIESEATNDLEQQLGRPPTDKEVEDEVSERLDALVAESLAEFKEGDFNECLNFFTGHVLNFDLAPEEMVALQRAGILLLDGKVIITRENEDGTTTDYYRDYADADPRDNLLSLMTYIPPYEPEEPPQECAFLFEDDDCLVKNERERCR